MVNIQIPRFFLPAFQALSVADSTQIQEIGIFLKNVPIGTGHVTFEKMFDEKFESLAISGLASTVFSLASFTLSEYKDLQGTELLDALGNSYKSQASVTEDDTLNNLKSNLRTIFDSMGNLTASYKVFSLLSENSRIYKDCRIVSDIRLVFKDDIDDEKRDALVIHRLKINVGENNKSKEYFFSLDTSDLNKLGEQITRAQEKDRLIKEQYKNAMTFITITQ